MIRVPKTMKRPEKSLRAFFPSILALLAAGCPPAVQAQTYYDDVSPGGVLEKTGSAAALMQAQIQQLEAQLRDLTGRSETLENRTRLLSERLERMNADVDSRLQSLEVAASAPMAPAATTTGAPSPTVSTPPSTAAITAPVSAVAPPSPSTASASGKAVATPEAQYKQAMDLLYNHDYQGAERALRAFVERYPDSSLVGNALYWIGETLYIRRLYKDAIVAFSDAYTHDEKGSKSTHSLLKLAMSFQEDRQTDKACTVYQELLKGRDSVEAYIVAEARQAVKALSCP